MDCINKLIALGFNFSVNNGQIAYEYRGKNPPDLGQVKPLMEELKKHKAEAAKYTQTLIIYEIPEGENFNFQVHACLDAAKGKGLEWYRLDVYEKSRKFVLVGAIKRQDWLEMWQEVDKNSPYYKDCPWVS